MKKFLSILFALVLVLASTIYPALAQSTQNVDLKLCKIIEDTESPTILHMITYLQNGYASVNANSFNLWVNEQSYPATEVSKLSKQNIGTSWIIVVDDTANYTTNSGDSAIPEFGETLKSEILSRIDSDTDNGIIVTSYTDLSTATLSGNSYEIMQNFSDDIGKSGDKPAFCSRLADVIAWANRSECKQVINFVFVKIARSEVNTAYLNEASAALTALASKENTLARVYTVVIKGTKEADRSNDNAAFLNLATEEFGAFSQTLTKMTDFAAAAESIYNNAGCCIDVVANLPEEVRMTLAGNVAVSLEYVGSDRSYKSNEESINMTEYATPVPVITTTPAEEPEPTEVPMPTKEPSVVDKVLTFVQGHILECIIGGVILACVILIIILIPKKKNSKAADKAEDENVTKDVETKDSDETRTVSDDLMVKLTNSTGGYVFDTMNGRMILGRSPGNGNLEIPGDDYISREHAEIRYDAVNNIMKLRPLSKKNPTYVNANEVTGEIVIHNGDTLRMGRTDVVITWDRLSH